MLHPHKIHSIELAAGHVDMTMGSLRLPKRDAYANYLPYAWLQYDLLLTQSGGQHFTSLGDWK